MSSSPAFEQPSIFLSATIDELMELAAQLHGLTDPLVALEQIRLVELQAKEARREAITSARLEKHSWRKIGNAMGVSPQAAQQTYAQVHTRKK